MRPALPFLLTTVACTGASPSPTAPVVTEPAPVPAAPVEELRTSEPEPPPEEAAPVASAIPEARRKEIFVAMVKAQDRAEREADAKYPTDASRIPAAALDTYDFREALLNYGAERERLVARYQDEVIARYRISAADLESIDREAFLERWPIPAPR